MVLKDLTGIRINNDFTSHVYCKYNIQSILYGYIYLQLYKGVT